jgi:glycosyltransferase involved in cell wall biosynthesis
VVNEKRKINGVGYGYAHQSGMKHATGDIVIALDGDDTYPIEKIREIVSYMEKSGTDFVSCSRFPLADNKAISPIRQLGIRILNTQVSLLYGYQIKDILSGMWAIRKDSIKKIKVKKGDWNFSPEIKLAALMHPEVHFSEYHIAHAVRLNGLSKQNIWKTGTDHLLYIIGRRMTVDSNATKQQIAYIINTFAYIRRGFSRKVSERLSI